MDNSKVFVIERIKQNFAKKYIEFPVKKIYHTVQDKVRELKLFS